VAFFFLGKFMRRKGVRSNMAFAVFALAFSVLAAPVPTPIITIFVPHCLALFDGEHPFVTDHPFFAELIPWFATSLVTTSFATFLLARRYIRPPSNPTVEGTLRDEAAHRPSLPR
jgi:hypothetical protein